MKTLKVIGLILGGIGILFSLINNNIDSAAWALAYAIGVLNWYD